MSSITYRGVNLDIIRTREVLNVPIMSSDRTTYLYTQRTVDFDCWYNPRATAYTRPVFPLPVVTPNAMPFSTDNALQHYLSQPRGKLVVNMGNGEIIHSPRNLATVDAKGIGPVVEACE